MRNEYDVIIIGGGLAGLVAAARLSQDRTRRILVVDAGRDCRGDFNIDCPGMLGKLWGKPEYDRGYRVVPQASLNGREVDQRCGKAMGGSAAINGTTMLFPSPRDFDAWTKLGNKGWTADDMAPYYRKFINFHPPSAETAKFMSLDEYVDPSLYGTDGPIAVGFSENFGPLDRAFVDAVDATGAGHGKKTDPVLGRLQGSFAGLTSIDPITRKRSYPAEGYFTAMAEKRNNVELMTETLVNSISLVNRPGRQVEADGISVQTKDRRYRFISGRQVILAAGSLQSPLILERSGIGNKALLDGHGIRVFIENAGVGENLQDHVYVPMGFEVRDHYTTRDVVRDPAIWKAKRKEYAESRSGMLSHVPVDFAFLPPVDGAGRLRRTSLQALISAHGASPSHGAQKHDMLPARQLAELKSLIQGPDASAIYLAMLAGQMHVNPQGRTTTTEAYTPRLPQNLMTVMPGLNHALSRGSVHMANRAPKTPPVIDPRYLTHPLDVELLARAVQFVDTLVKQEPLKRVLKPDGLRLPDARRDLTDLETAKEVVRERAWSNYHPSCSCPMLPRDQGGVVDHRCRVYGASNIRIIDASIFPLIPQGDIQATVYAVAERACDLIKEDWKRDMATRGRSPCGPCGPQ